MKKLMFVFMICLVSWMVILADDIIPVPDIPVEAESTVGDLIAEDSTNNGIGDSMIFGTIAAFIIPFIVGLLKKTLKLSKGLQPVIAFIIGIIFGVVVYYLKLVPDLSLLQSVVFGAMVGGSSTGLFNIKKRAMIFLKKS